MVWVSKYATYGSCIVAFMGIVNSNIKPTYAHWV